MEDEENEMLVPSDPSIDMKRLIPWIISYREKVEEVILAICKIVPPSTSPYDLKRIEKASFDRLCEANTKLISESFAKFFSSLFSKEFKSSNGQLIETIEASLIIFRSIRAYDVFEATYKSELANRISLDLVSDRKFEAEIIKRLDSECSETHIINTLNAKRN